MVAGHTSVDVVTAPTGKNVQPGGAALYAAIAARIFNNDVRLATSIGTDYEYHELLKQFPNSTIVMANTKSCRFEIEYDDRWSATYNKSEYMAARFLKADRVVTAAQGCSYVHLAPMPPRKISKMVHGLRERPGLTISLNSWEGYMKEGNDRRLLRELAPLVDFFIINEKEIMKLAEVDNLNLAVNSLPAKQLIVTLGHFGAIYAKEGRFTIYPATTWFGGNTVDATGAGDVWCGAFIGAYSLEQDVPSAVSAAGTISALKCRGWNFQEIERLKFDSVNDLVRYALSERAEGQQTLTRFLR